MHGVQKPRELKHDAELYRAYMEEAERLRDEGANIHRIVLENDLKTRVSGVPAGAQSRS